MEEVRQQEVAVEEGITLSDLLRIVWNNITIVFLVTLWVTVIGVVITWYVIDPKYTAETGIMIEVDPETMVGTGSESGAVSLAQQLVITYKDFALDSLVLSSVIDDIPALAGMTPSQLKDAITLSSVTSSVIVRIEVVSDSPEMAALIANTLVLNSMVLAEDHRFLEGRVTQMLPAEAPSNPTSPNKILNVVISFLIGGILSLGIVFVKELFNNKFQTPAEMEKYLSINVIAAVPGTIKERKLVD